MNWLVRILGVLLIAPMGGCVIDTVPLPEDQPESASPDDRADQTAGDAAPSVNAGIQSEALYYAASGETMVLVGLVGAVPALGKVIVINAARSTEDSATANSDGAFALGMNAAVGETVEVSVEVSGQVVDSVTLYLEAGSVDSYAAGANLDSGAEAQEPDDNATADPPAPAGEPLVSVGAPAGGLATVTGSPGVLFPGITVVVANLVRGASAAAVVANDGGFAATIAAESGDTLLLFAVENAGANAGSSATSLAVP